MAERPALDVLSGQPDRNAVGQHSGKRQFFCAGPVDGSLIGVGKHRLAALATAFELLGEREAFRVCLQRVVDFYEPFERNPGLRLPGDARWHRLRNGRHEILFRLERLEDPFERGPVSSS